MKNKTIMFQKIGDFLKPAHYADWNDMQDSVEDKGWLQGVFSKPKKPKSCKQLGWLYAKKEKNGIYEFMVSHFLDKWGANLYEVEIHGMIIETETNVFNVDIMMKYLYCKKVGVKEFNKTEASTESLNDYIKFLDEFSIQNFGYELPLPKKQGE